jgi:hypothetical protein
VRNWFQAFAFKCNLYRSTAVSIQFAFSLNYRAGFLMRFMHMSFSRLLMMFMVNPLEAFLDDPAKAQIPMFTKLIPMFLGIFDLVTVEDFAISANAFPMKTKMSSGTVIPAGFAIDIKGLEFFNCIRVEAAHIALNLLSLKPTFEAHVFIAPLDFSFGPLRLFIGGVPPHRRRALQGVLNAKAATEAAEEEAAREAIAAQMGEETCPKGICKTCGTFPGGTSAVIGCGNGEQIIGFADAVFAVSKTLPQWWGCKI